MRFRNRSRAVVGVALATFAAAWLGWQAGAEAQPRARGNGTAGADLTLTGSVTSAIMLRIDGSTDTRSGATTTIAGGGPSGIVNFGVYNIPGAISNGEKHRVNSNPKGTYLVATLSVEVAITGVAAGSNVAVDIQRKNPCGGPPDVACGGPPNGQLFFAFQGVKTRGKSKAPLSWPQWKNYPEARYGASVFAVPDSSYVPGAGNIDNLMTNGDFLEHQVAVWVPDSQPAGAFVTTVTYTATKL